MDTLDDFITDAWYAMFGLDYLKWKRTHPRGAKKEFEEELRFSLQAQKEKEELKRR